MIRNKLHLKAPGNWINDPNGFIWFNGEYHLFYQHFPYEPMWGTMHWGHAVSGDLVNWTHKDIALYPSQYGDKNGCFSGSAIEKDGLLYLYYTGVRYEVTTKEDIHHCVNDQFESCQMMITSPDGIRFDNFHDKKMIIEPVTNPKIGDRVHTRDPKVWKGEQAYYMVLGSSTKEKRGELLFYKSEDMENWNYVNSYQKAEEDWGWMWECPDMFQADGETVLIVSPMGFLNEGEWEPNQSLCMLASFQEKTCTLQTSKNYQFVDYGLDLYAPQSTLDKEGRRVMTAWIRMPRPVEGKKQSVQMEDSAGISVLEESEKPWIGMMCQPRIVEVKEGHIYFRIHPNVEHAFQTEVNMISEIDFSQPYQIKLKLEEGETISVGGYQISRKGNCIYTDRAEVFDGILGCRTAFQTPVLKEDCSLNIFVDSNLIEVFVNDGEYVISNVVYDLKQNVIAPIKGSIEIRQM